MDFEIGDIGYIEDIRRRIGILEDDTSCDDEILKMEPMERVRKLCGWNLGDEGWADSFHSWLESQGLWITANPEADGVIYRT